MLVTLLKPLFLPPAIQLICLLLSLLLRRSQPWLSRFLMFFGVISLYVLSLPTVSHGLYQWLEKPYAAATPKSPPNSVQAIVVLGAGRHINTKEYGGDTVSQSMLWRLRYGALLAKQWHLPLIVSGGSVYPEDQLSEAVLAVSFLRDELGVENVWLEERSRNTWENAHYTGELLEKRDLKQVALVTHGYHMRRASYSFERANISHVPMPTGMEAHLSVPITSFRAWVPKAKYLNHSSVAIHEYLGLIFYRLK